MIRPIVTDPAELSVRSTNAAPAEIEDIVRDLIDTANAQDDRPVLGLAAIQIGIPKRVAIIRDGNPDDKRWKVIINPMVMKKSKSTFLSEEGCASLPKDVTNKVMRHHSIDVLYTQRNKKVKKETLRGTLSVVCQHEVGHMNGELI